MPILDPEAVEKLVKHFAKNSGIRVVLDYSARAVPRTTSDGVVYIPAFNEEDEFLEMLGSMLHESGHIEYDKKHNAAFLRLFGAPDWMSLLSNLVADARIDARRCDEYPGCRTIYGEVWKKTDQRLKEHGVHDDIKEICQGCMTRALGFDELAPVCLGVSRKYQCHQPLTDGFVRCKGDDGPLVLETFKSLEVLGSDRRLPIPPQPKDDQGRPMPVPPADQLEAARAVLSQGIQQMEAMEDEERHMDIVRSTRFRRACDLIARRVFGDFKMPPPAKNVAGPNGQTGKTTCGCGWNPVSNVGKEKAEGGITPEDVEAYKNEMFHQAVRAFVEVCEMVQLPTEDRFILDQERLAGLMTDPLDLFVGEEFERDDRTLVDVIIDCSGSMDGNLSDNTRLGVALAGLRLWVKQCQELSSKHLRMGVLLFSDTAKRLVPFEDVDMMRLERLSGKAVRECMGAGGTDLAVAFKKSLADLDLEDARKKAVITISDGDVLADAVQFARNEWPPDVPLAILTVGEEVEEGNVGGVDALFRFRASTFDAIPVIFARTLRKAVAG